MQLVERRATAQDPTITVGPSLAVELSWVLLAAESEQLRDDHPDLQLLYRDDPGLGERVRSFWGEGVADFGELLVLADQGKVIGTLELAAFLKALDGAAATSSADFPLASEREEDRAVFLDRLGRLRASAKLREDYLRLIGDAWARIGEAWEANGHDLVDAVADRYKRRLEGGASWIDLVVGDSTHLSSILPSLVGLVPPGGTVTIAPSFYSGHGLVFDLPSRMLIGVPASSGGRGARARTEVLARRLKSLADPSRLAIVAYLATGPRTVGEIAQYLDLAQPTVSNHAKVLRDAGVVSGTRRGSRLELSLDRGAAERLLDELRAVATPAVAETTL